MSLFYCLTFILLQIPGLTNIQNKILNFEKEEGIQQGVVSLTVKDCLSDQNLISVHGNKSVNSASTLKLITTATAIEMLGSDFTFETKLGYSGEIINDELLGNLYLSGNGDPSFGSERFGLNTNTQISRFAKAIFNTGLKSVKGDLILMNSNFDKFDIADTWPWNDMGNYYGATPYLININENKFNIYFDSGAIIGSPAEIIKLEPFSSSWKVINQVTTGEIGSGDKVYIYSSPLSNTILMKGTIPLRAKSFRIRGAIPNPPQLLGELLVSELNKFGVALEGKILFQSYFSADTKNLYVERSKPLRDLAESCNFYSINLFADSFLKQLSYRQNRSFSYQAGIKTLTDFWNARNIDTKQLLLKDGSGLSPGGTITTSVMCDILNLMRRSANFETFKSTIPQLGVSGTVARIGNRTNGNVYVKSGSIESTKAYAGYIQTRSGQWLTFMACVNRFHPDASEKVNRFLKEILLDFSNLH